MAVDVREPDLRGEAALSAAYAAKAAAELADADAVVGAAPGAWEGVTVGPRIAFVIARAASSGTVLETRVAEAAAKAADALGAGTDVFCIATRTDPPASPDARARRLRLGLEAVDAPAVIALDVEAAGDLASAFGADALRPGTPTRVFGRVIGYAGDFAASLDDDPAKVRAWSAMKTIAAAAGLDPKERPRAPRQG
jgi:hypothetical protein